MLFTSFFSLGKLILGLVMSIRYKLTPQETISPVTPLGIRRLRKSTTLFQTSDF